MSDSKRKAADKDRDSHTFTSPSRRATNNQTTDSGLLITKDDVILRKGKWTTEEEDYANKIINLFNRGLLPIIAGTTLRSFLSDTLHW